MQNGELGIGIVRYLTQLSKPVEVYSVAQARLFRKLSTLSSGSSSVGQSMPRRKRKCNGASASFSGDKLKPETCDCLVFFKILWDSACLYAQHLTHKEALHNVG